MKVELVPSSMALADSCRDQFSTSYIINDTLAIDAGGLGFYRGPVEQARIKHVLISHTHMDHIASLPIFVENVYEGKPECVTIHGSADVLSGLARDVFNDRVWPDFIKLSTIVPAPFLKLQTLQPRQRIEVEGLKITPVEVNHVVPTLGFIVEESDAAMIVVSDTGPTEEILGMGQPDAEPEGGVPGSGLPGLDGQARGDFQTPHARQLRPGSAEIEARCDGNRRSSQGTLPGPDR